VRRANKTRPGYADANRLFGQLFCHRLLRDN
jgi:hypothetical protein